MFKVILYNINQANKFHAQTKYISNTTTIEMKYKLVKIDKLSGDEASIYSVIKENESGNFEESFFDSFIKENKSLLLSEIKNRNIAFKDYRE